MNTFFSFSYWTDNFPGDPNLGFWKVIFVVSAAAIILGIIGIIGMRRQKNDGIRKRLFGKLIAWGFTIGLVYLLLALFRFERAVFLSMRLWYLLWTLFAVLWGLLILRYRLWVMPKRIQLRSEKQAFAKYLPSRKS